MMSLTVTPPGNPCHYAPDSLSSFNMTGAGDQHDIL
jgi:hypothetical protein